jgi:UDP-2,3-diacylglucosamine hydrolase
MRVWIYSDLHLKTSDSWLYQALMASLKDPSGPGDVVVFSGDIFDLLVGGSDYFKLKYQSFFAAVSRLAEKGVELHYIEGNHDFHLRELFPRAMKFHEESVVLSDDAFVPSKKIYIAHGDLVDQADQSYLLLRGLLRSKPIEKLSSFLPGKIIDFIGETFSRPLAQKADEVPERWSSEKQAHLREVFREFAAQKHASGIDFVVLGHCHDLDQVEPYYFNMGYPPLHKQFLFYDGVLQRISAG